MNNFSDLLPRCPWCDVFLVPRHSFCRWYNTCDTPLIQNTRTLERTLKRTLERTLKRTLERTLREHWREHWENTRENTKEDRRGNIKENTRHNTSEALVQHLWHTAHTKWLQLRCFRTKYKIKVLSLYLTRIPSHPINLYVMIWSQDMLH